MQATNSGKLTESWPRVYRSEEGNIQGTNEHTANGDENGLKEIVSNLAL